MRSPIKVNHYLPVPYLILYLYIANHTWLKKLSYLCQLKHLASQKEAFETAMGLSCLVRNKPIYDSIH